LKEIRERYDDHHIITTDISKEQNKQYLEKVIDHKNTRGGYVYVLSNSLYPDCYKVGE
jgi:hypothetical protein